MLACSVFLAGCAGPKGPFLLVGMVGQAPPYKARNDKENIEYRTRNSEHRSENTRYALCFTRYELRSNDVGDFHESGGIVSFCFG